MENNEKNEAAGVDAPATSESENPTGEVKPQESVLPIAPPHEEGKNEYQDLPPIIITETNLVPIGDLTPHPKNQAIYGEELDAKFIEAVKKNGVYQPLLVTSKGVIISGHRRYAAAKVAGITEVPVARFHSDNETEILAALVEANRQREKTHEQISREFSALKTVEEERAKARMSKGGQGVKSITPLETGKSRDIAAAKLGLSGVTADRGAAVVMVLDKLLKSGKTKKAEELRTSLNKSFQGAYERAVRDGHIKKESKSGKGGSDSGKKQTTTTGSTSDKKSSQKDAYDPAFQGLCDAETFIASAASGQMTAAQKSDWHKVVLHLVNMLTKMGFAFAEK